MAQYLSVWIQLILRILLDAGPEVYTVPAYQPHLSHLPQGQGHRLKVYSFTVPGW